MKKLFARNIGNAGRLVRGLFAVGLFVAAGFTFKSHFWIALVLGALGCFTIFEALRGWCGLRACGIKTKI